MIIINPIIIPIKISVFFFLIWNADINASAKLKREIPITPRKNV